MHNGAFFVYDQPLHSYFLFLKHQLKRDFTLKSHMLSKNSVIFSDTQKVKVKTYPNTLAHHLDMHSGNKSMCLCVEHPPQSHWINRYLKIIGK